MKGNRLYVSILLLIHCNKLAIDALSFKIWKSVSIHAIFTTILLSIFILWKDKKHMIDDYINTHRNMLHNFTSNLIDLKCIDEYKWKNHKKHLTFGTFTFYI